MRCLPSSSRRAGFETMISTRCGAEGIRIRGPSQRFRTQVIFDDLTLDVIRGEVLGVAGASGTGKSVLLRAITGLVPADRGSVEIFGHDMARLNWRDRLAIEARWGVLFQDGALF